jgi:hypothetical protein
MCPCHVDVHRSWRSGPAIIAGGSSGGRDGITRVTTTTVTAAIVLATIAMVVVLVPVVVAVGRSGQRGMLWLRSWRRSAGVERRRSSG